MTTMTPPPLPSASEQEKIPFNCPACLQSCKLSVDMVGKNFECPYCKEKVKVPFYTFSINPFQRPIQKILKNLSSIRWSAPFFPNIIEVLVLAFVALVTIGLYITIGVASQISGMFMNLVLDARQEIKTGGLTEKSAYAVAGGIYIVLGLPFLLLMLPFTIIGWLWKHLGYYGLLILVIVIGIGFFILCNPYFLSTIDLRPPFN